MNRAHTIWPATALALATVLAACGSDDPDQSGTDIATPEQTTDDATDTGATTTEQTTTEQTTTDDASETSSEEAMGAGPVVTTSETDLGQILVDGEGMTLYLFTQDSPNTSVCVDDCLAAWPILEGEPTAGEGADDSKLGSFTREDGRVQATYNEWPLYYFAQDQAPGDTTGQAVNDVWWVIDRDGEAVTGAADDTTGGGIDY
jgi:predicted lipoprotein with Yx(FWY)xxD motif